MKRAMLVYQGKIANVFEVECFNLSKYGREAELLLRGCFGECEAFARSLGTAGVTIRTAACDQSGDITNATWSEDLDAQPFTEHYNPVRAN